MKTVTLPIMISMWSLLISYSLIVKDCSTTSSCLLSAVTTPNVIYYNGYRPQNVTKIDLNISLTTG